MKTPNSVLEKIPKAGLMLNVGKCEWARQEANYLGYHLGNGQLLKSTRWRPCVKVSDRRPRRK